LDRDVAFAVIKTEGLDEDDLTFGMIPLKEAVFEEDHKGVPFYFFRKLEWTPTKLVSKFGRENVPQIVLDKYENPHQATETIPVIFAIFPRHEYLDADISRPLAPQVRPFGHVYFLEQEGIQIGEEGGYYEMPVFSVRYRKVSGSQWGHGPGHVSLGDIKQLNQHRLMRTRAIEKAVDPANVVTERGLLSNLDLGPRGLTVVRDADSLWPYESRANFQVSSEEIMMLQQSIKQAFRVDQLELKESPAMTATEVEVRYELMQRLLGPTLGRLKVDWLNRVVENVFRIERRAGRLLPVPGVIADLDLETEIEYIGAMAQAQKTQISNDMVMWASQMAELSPAYPDLQFLVNDDALGRKIARLKSIPEKVVNGVDEAAAKKKEMEQVTQQQQLLAQAQAEGEAMKAMGEGRQAMRGV
ncbi:MAG: portal protein, partial [bacterium]